jgi:hypothetical protein
MGLGLKFLNHREHNTWQVFPRALRYNATRNPQFDAELEGVFELRAATR